MKYSLKKIKENRGEPTMEDIKKGLPELTKKEKEILNALVQGKTKEELYSEMETNHSTINNQINTLQNKFRDFITFTPDKSKLSQIIEFVKNIKIPEYQESEPKENLKDKKSLSKKIKTEIQTNLKERNKEDSLIEPLTERELDILRHLCLGETYVEIAKICCISETTVKTHTNNIFNKLQVNDRANAILKGLSMGLVQQPVGQPEPVIQSAPSMQPMPFEKLKQKYKTELKNIALHLGLSILKKIDGNFSNELIKISKEKAAPIMQKLEVIEELEQESRGIA